MAQITWTAPALSDLDAIAEYIALDNIVAAKTLVQAVFNAVERLEVFPESGRVPPELEHLSYREVVVSPCRIFYKISGDEVFILFVLRQERDLKKYILSHWKN
ncbi:type II toxin-antitoxin system RelE/ParE family toxin [Photobacterium chitinilyticum]|uniref:Type II toxin-antitoxin system RelE/ParE family toxin n=1 Tax=Photobacterium chitinilyticum TaxID=2485123 RepID=A0A444JI52_9GAMM|nr:type II toxin-antitoxin system RelE/ParE family toxin [Photobacterium chitinilyticum]RWX52769.1 type II toxin-antitoxin system RelE/ParE family toxin [Photobacterium chitinilyticum]